MDRRMARQESVGLDVFGVFFFCVCVLGKRRGAAGDAPRFPSLLFLSFRLSLAGILLRI